MPSPTMPSPLPATPVRCDERSPAVRRAAARIDGYLRAPVEALRRAAEDFGAELAALHAVGAASAARLDELVEPHSVRLRALREPRVFGAGFVAARGEFGDADGHLAWWQGEPCRRLVPAAEAVRKGRVDYTALEWFRVPAATGRPHVAGPYVDYLCNDDYTVTFAAPVCLEARFLGVLALDVLVDTIERDLLPALLDTGEELVALSRNGRVLLSSDPRYETGDTVRGAALAAVPETPGHGFRVLAAAG